MLSDAIIRAVPAAEGRVPVMMCMQQIVQYMCIAGALLAAVVQGTQGCRDVARLCTAAGVLTQMAVLPHNDSAPIQALQAVLKTLTCTFPRVRVLHVWHPCKTVAYCFCQKHRLKQHCAELI